jgi:large subunit ribosomal protein L22
MAVAPTTAEKVLVRAKATYVRTSARKARVVLEHVRGRSYAQAHAYLSFATQHVARDILAVLESAAANAENNLELDSDELVVDACFADEGPTAKRWQPRARGRANRIRKRTCHVTIVLRHEPRPEGQSETRGRRGSAAAATLAATRRRRRQPEAAPTVAEDTALAGTAPLDDAVEAPEVEETAATADEPEAAAEAEPEATVEEPEIEPQTSDQPAEGDPAVEAAAPPPTTDEPAEGDRETIIEDEDKDA